MLMRTGLRSHRLLLTGYDDAIHETARFTMIRLTSAKRKRNTGQCKQILLERLASITC